ARRGWIGSCVPDRRLRSLHHYPDGRSDAVVVGRVAVDRRDLRRLLWRIDVHAGDRVGGFPDAAPAGDGASFFPHGILDRRYFLGAGRGYPREEKRRAF